MFTLNDKGERRLNDVSSDVAHLSHLMELLVGELIQDAGTSERAAALGWIARDMVGKIGDDLDAIFEGD